MISGNNKFARAINSLDDRMSRIRPKQVPDALVDTTTNGTFVRAKRNPRARAGSGGGGVPRWG